MNMLCYATIGFMAVSCVCAQQTDEKQAKGIIGRSYKDGLPVIWRFVNEADEVVYIAREIATAASFRKIQYFFSQ